MGSRRSSPILRRVVLNMVEDEAQAKAIFAKLYSIAQQFLGKPLEFAGFVRIDQRAVAHIRKRRPFLLADSTLPASQDLQAIAAFTLGQSYTKQGEGLVGKLRAAFGFGRRKIA